MISPLTRNRHVWEKRGSKAWSRPQFSRSRRPLYLALLTVLLFVWWQQSTSSSSDYSFGGRYFNPIKSDKRSSIGHDRIETSQGSPDRRLAVEDVRIQEETAHKHEGDGEHIHGIQLEQRQHLEHLEDPVHAAEDVQSPEVVHEQVPEDQVPQATPEEKEQLGTEHESAEHVETEVASANLDPLTEKEAVISFGNGLGSEREEKIAETEPNDHLSLEEKGNSLPEVVHRPFEDVVKDMVLEGWEDEWVSHASFNPKTQGRLQEPTIDFVYLWVNGSEEAFQNTKRPFELNSVLNDEAGRWISSHGTNRYRDWDELRYSLRSIEQHAGSFRNKIQILVNSVTGTEAGKQIPSWLNDQPATKDVVQVLAQEDFFDTQKDVCLPTFNSLTIENQLFNTPSNTDQLFALSDDMLLGKEHAASDIYSPLFGPVMGFKTNAYSTVNPPTDIDALRFGEKPFLIYTSWLLNRRFGIRKRKGQGHFGHSLSRSVMREAIGSFPGPELQSACKRFRGEPGFQLYSWYATFHYVIERHREALLWSYLMLRSDVDGDENLSWPERQTIMQDLEAGMKNEGKVSFRKRNFYHVAQLLERAGLQAPKVNTDIQWTSLDGPSTIQGLDCLEFDVNECLAPGFSTSSSDSTSRNPVFSTALVFDRVARQNPRCGDCLIKLILNKQTRGLGPLLPHSKTQAEKREIVVKAVMRYRYSIINPDALFVMVTDAEQIDSTLVSRFIRGKKELAGQLCLNDDVSTEDEKELLDVQTVMTELYQGLFPQKSPFEL